MRKNKGKGMLVAMLLCIAALVSAVVSVQATATTQVTVTKYAANNYSTVVNSTTLNYSQMNASLTVYGDGITDYFHQGPIFTDEWNSSNCPIYEDWTDEQCYGDHSGMGDYDVWDRNETMNFKTKGSPKGTDIKDLCEQVGGMSLGDEIQVHANDNLKKWFNYTNVYNNRANETLNNMQGRMVLTWYAYDNYTGTPDYYSGMRLVFFANTTTHVNTTCGENDLYVFGDWDMHECLAPWYWYYYYRAGVLYPSTNGLSVKYVDQLNIYPPHLHDFNTTGDTTGWAFGNETDESPGANDPNTEFDSTAYNNITDDDGTFQSDVTTADDNYAAHRFNFSIDTSTAKDGPIADIEMLNITWNGKGWHDNGDAANGTSLYIWNGTGYEELANNSGDGTEVYLTGEITSGISNYVSATNNVTVLVKQKSAQELEAASHIATDYVKLVVTHHHHN